MSETTFQRFATLTVALLVSHFAALSVQSDERQDVADTAKPNVDPAWNKERHQRWVELYGQDAASYRFYLDSDRTKKLKLEAEPVLFYTNPVGARGLTHGTVFIWTYKGRGEVIGAMWSHANTPKSNQRTVSHEFHSLSDTPVIAERDGVVVWSTKQAGVKWLVPDGAPRPSSSQFGRLAQMRNLTRALNVTRQDPKDNSKERLRLLPKPLWRNANGSSAEHDGAVFAYCVIWDPELFVVVEARETTDGPRWCYAPVRFSHLTLAVQHRKREVWRDVRNSPSHRESALGYKLFYKISVQSERLDSVGDNEERD